MKMSLLCEKNSVHVEVCLKESAFRLDGGARSLEEAIQDYIDKQEKLVLNIPIKINPESVNQELKDVETLLLERDVVEDNIRYFNIGEKPKNFRYHIYRPHDRPMEYEMFDNDTDDGSGDHESVPSSNHWLLPSSSFIGLWENLIYENGLKEKLLKFALSALSFSQHAVNTNIISCNRLLLLHGPPGTGKTSLCKALAQKLAIRARSCFRHTHLIEINSHSLFSKWFSESGKLVMRLFGKIHEITADKQNLVCVLIDEVESLAYARDCMSSQEPQDAMRVVNALLTQLDGIKEYSNVLILATSNLAETIDLAFLDRADIKQFIGLPSVLAIRSMYESMLLELMRVGIIREESIEAEEAAEGLITELAENSRGMSGRSLRKLPFLAHALHTATDFFDRNSKIPLADFLDAMLLSLDKHQQDEKSIQKVKDTLPESLSSETPRSNFTHFTHD